MQFRNQITKEFVEGVVLVDLATGLPYSSGDAAGGVFDTLIDVTNASVTYVCEAEIGSATSASVWRVARHTITGTVTMIRYAGTGEFDQVADDRASLTYA